jgi:hypothetical protein
MNLCIAFGRNCLLYQEIQSRNAKCGIKLWVLREKSFTCGIFSHTLGSSLEVLLKYTKA